MPLAKVKRIFHSAKPSQGLRNGLNGNSVGISINFRQPPKPPPRLKKGKWPIHTGHLRYLLSANASDAQRKQGDKGANVALLHCCIKDFPMLHLKVDIIYKY
ncbi:MAG: hypothetical protein K2H97_05765, partial [Prevotella sp.]|nr:hypothetical protein [Prevotella sp.]